MRKTLFVTTCLAGILLCHTTEAHANSEIATIASNYLHTPYKYGGTTPKGFDCSGFVQYVYKKMNIELPRTSRDQAAIGVAVDYSELRIGDIVYFRERSSGPVTHSGIYIGNNQFISSTTSSGVRVDDLSTSSYWINRYAGARRITSSITIPTNIPITDEFTSLYSDISYTDEIYPTLIKYYEKNIFPSIDGAFMPKVTVTRAEFAQLICKIVNPTIPYEETIVLNDIPENYWATSSIQFSVRNNYLLPFADGSFRPNHVVTKKEVHDILNQIVTGAETSIPSNLFLEDQFDLPITRMELVLLTEAYL